MAPFTRHLKHWPKGVPRHIDLPERSIAENLILTARATPEATAIHYYGRQTSYAQLLRNVEALAGWIVAQGVEKGDRVLLYMQNSPQYITAYYAILRADAVVVPVNPMNRSAELDYLVEDTGAKLAICGQELLEHLTPTPIPAILAAAYAEEADPAFPFRLAHAARRARGGARRHAHHTLVTRAGRGPRARPDHRGSGRPRADPLQLRHHRPAQGLHALAPHGDVHPRGQCHLVPGGRQRHHAGDAAALPRDRHAELDEHADLRRQAHRADDPLGPQARRLADRALQGGALALDLDHGDRPDQ